MKQKRKAEDAQNMQDGRKEDDGKLGKKVLGNGASYFSSKVKTKWS
jgi:hypothetical protein